MVTALSAKTIMNYNPLNFKDAECVSLAIIWIILMNAKVYTYWKGDHDNGVLEFLGRSNYILMFWIPK